MRHNRYSSALLDEPVGSPFRGQAYGEKCDPATLGMASSAIGIGSGLMNMFGGAGENKQIDPRQAQQMADPASQYRGQWAGQLNNLIMNPSSFMMSPMMQAANQAGLDSTSRQFAARGMSSSGNEQAALYNQGQANYQGYYQNMINSLSGMVGAPGGGANAALTAQHMNYGQQRQGMKDVTSGLGQLASIYGSQGGNTGWSGSAPSTDLSWGANTPANSGVDPNVQTELSSMGSGYWGV